MSNKAEPMTGKEVTGYRTLSAEEIALMNELKAISKQFIAKCTEVDLLNRRLADGDNPVILSSAQSFAGRWLAMAKTDMQTACMKACRGVAKPDDDC